MMAVVWETGDLIITSLLLWLAAGSIGCGLLCAGAAWGAAAAWRALSRRLRASNRPEVLREPPILPGAARAHTETHANEETA